MNAIWRWAAALALMLDGVMVVAQTATPAADDAQAVAERRAASLHPQQGHIVLRDARATLDLGQAYDFYGPDDARTIIVELWNNPPSVADGVLGMVMPAGKSPLSDAWGAVVTYDPSGHVDDGDANDTDYAEILESLKKATEERNADRIAKGYQATHLSGWAEYPQYNPVTHSVVWAQDLAFEGEEGHGLNYDLRTLGRNGVLSVNFVSSMARLPEIRAAAASFADHAAFDPGARYADYDPSIDKKAEYGVGGLVAAGLGVVLAKKLGLLALFVKFIKPLSFAVIAFVAVLRKRIGGMFRRGGE
jgi:uncharacterized membrane-anchored protein